MSPWRNRLHRPAWAPLVLLLVPLHATAGLASHVCTIPAHAQSFSQKSRLYMKSVGPSAVRWATSQLTPFELPTDPGIRFYNPAVSIAAPEPQGVSTSGQALDATTPEVDVDQAQRDQTLAALLELLEPGEPQKPAAGPLLFAPPAPILPASSATFNQR